MAENGEKLFTFKAMQSQSPFNLTNIFTKANQKLISQKKLKHSKLPKNREKLFTLL